MRPHPISATAPAVSGARETRAVFLLFSGADVGSSPSVKRGAGGGSFFQGFHGVKPIFFVRNGLYVAVRESRTRTDGEH